MFYLDGFIYWSANPNVHFKSDLYRDITIKINDIPKRLPPQLNGLDIKIQEDFIYVGKNRIFKHSSIMNIEDCKEAMNSVATMGSWVTYWIGNSTQIVDASTNTSHQLSFRVITTPDGFFRFREPGFFTEVKTDPIREKFSMSLIKSIHMS